MAVYTAINDPEAYFQTVLYTGDGAANHAITLPGDTDMQPDLVWIKNRDAADSHCLFDVTRGATKVLHTDTDAAEATDADTLDSFASDGFQVDADVKVNTNTEKYVAWCWNTQGGAGSSNTDGSINTTTTSVGATQGVSISTYVGTGANATIGHGLGVAPKLVIAKKRDSTNNWFTYHVGNTAAPETDFLGLNTDSATSDNNSLWNDTAPTSTVFSLGTAAEVNGDTINNVAYAFAEKQGFSKFGDYVGSGNANGPFIYTGFRPAFIQIKRTDSSGDWGNFDHLREGYNDENNRLKPNGTDTTEDDNFMDILSNGFKIRVTSGSLNADGGTYIFSAFAIAPFTNSNGVPTTAV